MLKGIVKGNDQLIKIGIGRSRIILVFAIIRREVFKISNVVKVKHRAKWIACVQRGKWVYIKIM